MSSDGESFFGSWGQKQSDQRRFHHDSYPHQQRQELELMMRGDEARPVVDQPEIQEELSVLEANRREASSVPSTMNDDLLPPIPTPKHTETWTAGRAQFESSQPVMMATAISSTIKPFSQDDFHVSAMKTEMPESAYIQQQQLQQLSEASTTLISAGGEHQLLQQEQSQLHSAPLEERRREIHPHELQQVHEAECRQEKNRFGKEHLAALHEAEKDSNAYPRENHPLPPQLSLQNEKDEETTTVSKNDIRVEIEEVINSREDRRLLDPESRRLNERREDGEELKPSIVHPVMIQEEEKAKEEEGNDEDGHQKKKSSPATSGEMSRMEERKLRHLLSTKASQKGGELSALVFGTLASADPNFHKFLLRKILAKKNEVTHALPLARDLESLRVNTQQSTKEEEVVTTTGRPIAGRDQVKSSKEGEGEEERLHFTSTHLETTQSLAEFTKIHKLHAAATSA